MLHDPLNKHSAPESVSAPEVHAPYAAPQIGTQSQEVRAKERRARTVCGQPLMQLRCTLNACPTEGQRKQEYIAHEAELNSWRSNQCPARKLR
jgi:hypothetical protein